MTNPLEGKRLFVSGGTGSFGQKFTELALTHNPEEMRIYSRGEFLQWEMERKFNDPRLKFIIGDIRDKDRLRQSLLGVEIVVHAAALKFIPPGEYNPIEFVRTNIDGAINLVDAAIEAKVSKVFGISTDKCAHPINLYGATKMIMEKLFIQANEYSDTKFSCSRYGNVINARGEVLSLFLQQAKQKVFTITDERMTRFWLTVEEGVRFVIDCIDRMLGGEIFVPKIPAIRIVDLAKAIEPKAELKIIGIRPGEKLGEILISEEEARHSRGFGHYCIIEPSLLFWEEKQRKLRDKGEKLLSLTRYTSNDTDWRLSIEEIRSRLIKLGVLKE